MGCMITTLWKLITQCYTARTVYIHYYACSTWKTFLRDFPEITNFQLAQNSNSLKSFSNFLRPIDEIGKFIGLGMYVYGGVSVCVYCFGF